MGFPSIVSIAGLAAASLTSPLDSEASHSQIRFRSTKTINSESLHNIHLEYTKTDFIGDLSVLYGDCQSSTTQKHHHFIGRTDISAKSRPERFVWSVPRDAFSGGCIHAFSGEKLVGRSVAITIEAPLKKRQVIADVADISGPWFDGVAYMASKPESSVFVAEAKNKSIAIIGGGSSGLLTSHLLQSVGIENWQIMESSQRIGGRIRTKYLNGSKPEDYQYQEMGPMRFPVSLTYHDSGETLEIKDHEMVFQLGEVLNAMNKDNPELAVNFIPWIQSSPNAPITSNGVRLPNGQAPSKSQVAANSSLAGVAQASSNATELAYAKAAVEKFYGLDRNKTREFASNIYLAHKHAIENGHFDFSVANYLRYKLGISLNVTDFIGGAGGHPMWEYEDVYFAATTWRTIDKGLESLPRAFLPHVQNKTTFGRIVSGLTYIPETDKISVKWRDADDKLSMETKSAEFDYAVVAAPFSKVRLWRTPPYSSLLSRAIATMNYSPSCKLSLHYKTRFWEHMNPPIIGGCGSTDIPGVGSVCYPAYKINSTGPGVILASYISGTPAVSVQSLSEEDHVAMIQRAMIEIHGPIAAEQWTGNYDRQCWQVDEHQAGAWASPLVGQQDLFLPAYYNTEFKTVFIGEHTSYTHAWIYSALDSAVRGTVQVLLDMGLVDEAKTIVTTWMGRWITL
ncbi:related to L-amino-acid oxidase [Rhynchosporium graminicola]|uniref:Related to L-amino-acid oxidase n=1 Tax=Rhynchosporium graminicola TaxID=2792576 RepID=A0A1E1JX73_9HELO|nr:related to L-amino-acid oxidase [Rhynchosporium commune]